MNSKSNQSSEPAKGSTDPAMQQDAMPGGIPDEDPFGRFIQFLKKRAWLIGIAVGVGLLIGVMANYFLPKLYTAQATIEVQSNDPSSQFRLEQIQGLTGGEDTSQRLDTEIEIIRSRTLALETIRTLHLDSNADFVALRGGHPWDLSDPATRDKLINHLRGITRISRIGHTSIIQILVTSKRP